ncbi:MAG: hypothetical protein JRN09_09050, partial [Nitrososphaerota archaeon]|nr:hypothetical protein [Nitrososphaerota archaeon]
KINSRPSLYDMSAKGRGGVYGAVGAGLMLIAILVLQSMLGNGLLSTKMITSTETTTVSAIPEAYQQLANVSANHLLTIESGNVSSLLSGYESNATLELTGMAPGLVGTYNGTSEIAALIKSSFPGSLDNLTLSNVNVTITGPRGQYWVVKSAFDWSGFSRIEGPVWGTIIAQDTYVHQPGGSWAIARATWNSISYTCVHPGCLF